MYQGEAFLLALREVTKSFFLSDYLVLLFLGVVRHFLRPEESFLPSSRFVETSGLAVSFSTFVPSGSGFFSLS